VEVKEDGIKILVMITELTTEAVTYVSEVKCCFKLLYNHTLNDQR